MLGRSRWLGQLVWQGLSFAVSIRSAVGRFPLPDPFRNQLTLLVRQSISAIVSGPSGHAPRFVASPQGSVPLA